MRSTLLSQTTFTQIRPRSSFKLRGLLLQTILGLSCCLMLSCSSVRRTLRQHSGESICIGTSGGFTGMTQGFCLSADATLCPFTQRLADRTPGTTVHIDESDAANFFKRVEQLQFDSLNSKLSGNMIFFLELRKDSSFRSIRWLPNDSTRSGELRSLFSDIMRYSRDHYPSSDSSAQH